MTCSATDSGGFAGLNVLVGVATEWVIIISATNEVRKIIDEAQVSHHNNPPVSVSKVSYSYLLNPVIRVTSICLSNLSLKVPDKVWSTTMTLVFSSWNLRM